MHGTVFLPTSLHQLLSTVFQETTQNIFIYQIFPITLSCFLVFVYRVLEATLPSLRHLNLYVLLLLVWRRGVVVTALVVSTKLLYVEPG